MSHEILKRNLSGLHVCVFLAASSFAGCSADGVTGVGQNDDALKGGIAADGKNKTKDHGKPSAAGSGGSEQGQGDEHKNAGHGAPADPGSQAAGHSQGDAHSQAGHGAPADPGSQAAGHSQGDAHSQAGHGASDDDMDDADDESDETK